MDAANSSAKPKAGSPAAVSPGVAKAGTELIALQNRFDVAVTWPPERAPLIIAVYTAPVDPGRSPDNTVLAAAARIATPALVPAG